MKTNIKMRVTPEQSKRVQELCFENKIFWRGDYNKDKINLEGSFLYIESSITHDMNDTESEHFFREYDSEEIDADLFIRTNGTCEENNSSIDYETLRVSHLVLNSKYEELEEKLEKKNEILKKARIKRKNQREGLNKLNLKLQKCISLEEHHLKMKTVLNEKHKLEVENKSLKESSKISCNMLHQQRDTIVSLRDEVIIKVDNMRDTKNKEIEKLKAVIEYLESKVK